MVSEGLCPSFATYCHVSRKFKELPILAMINFIGDLQRAVSYQTDDIWIRYKIPTA